MKLLIAVFSCHRYVYQDINAGMSDWLEAKRKTEDRAAGLRSTWLQDAAKFGFDYKIFKGRSTNTPSPDEVFLDCRDDYFHSAEKMKAVAQWALEHGYDYVFKVDDDSFVYLDRLVASGFEQCDYCGRDGKGQDFIPGGPGYWLSRRALEALVKSQPPQPPTQGWQEDVWVGRVLAQNGMRPRRDRRYFWAGETNHEIVYVDPQQLPTDHDYIAMTACAVGDMETLYRQWKA